MQNLSEHEIYWRAFRCKGSKTKPIAEYIIKRGIVCFCPIYSLRIRLPRRRRVVFVERPVLPSFIFVGQSSVFELEKIIEHEELQIREMKFNSHPIAIRYEELLPLVEFAEKNVGSDEVNFPKGSEVDISFGPFSGRTGIVMGFKNNYVHIKEKESGFVIQIKPFLFARKVA